MIQGIDHVNIVVNDMDAMVTFYREALGLRETRRATIGGHWIQEITGLPLGTVKTNLHRARKILAKTLTGMGFEP